MASSGPESQGGGSPSDKALQLTVKGRVPIDLWYALASNSGAPLDLERQPLPAAERPVR